MSACIDRVYCFLSPGAEQASFVLLKKIRNDKAGERETGSMVMMEMIRRLID